MNKLSVVGIGPGNTKYITSIALEHLNNAQVIIGAKRNLQSVRQVIDEDKIYIELTGLNSCMDDINEYIKDKRVAVAVSGDTGFYSLLDHIKKHVNTEIETISGISSFQYLYAKLNRNYANVKLMSMHGRNVEDISSLVKKQEVFLLLDKENSSSKIALKLYQAGVRDKYIIVGERLSYDDEKITKMTIQEGIDYQADDLSVMVICDE